MFDVGVVFARPKKKKKKRKFEPKHHNFLFQAPTKWPHHNHMIATLFSAKKNLAPRNVAYIIETLPSNGCHQLQMPKNRHLHNYPPMPTKIANKIPSSSKRTTNPGPRKSKEYSSPVRMTVPFACTQLPVVSIPFPPVFFWNSSARLWPIQYLFFLGESSSSHGTWGRDNLEL